MKLLPSLTAFLCLLLIPGFSEGQDEPVRDTSKNILLTKEIGGGIILHNRGFGIKFFYAKSRTFEKKVLFETELVEMKSFKQIRSINPYLSNSKSYIYGKLNTVFNLRAGLGAGKTLNRKPYWGGVELGYFYRGGATLAIAKPIYLYIYYPYADDFEIKEEKFNPEKHTIDDIYGRAPFTKGLDEIKLYPGIYAKAGLNFEFGVYRAKVKELEVGAAIEVFPNPVPIMAQNDPNYYFLTFFANFCFGKRYN